MKLEKQILYDITYMWNLKYDTNELIYITEIDSQTREQTYESESEVAQSCPTLCNPVDCSLPGSTVPGILQARILEWVSISFSRGIFPAHGSNPGLPHCRWILYQLSYRGSPSKMEGSSQSIIVLCAIRGFPLELLFLEVSKL